MDALFLFLLALVSGGLGGIVLMASLDTNAVSHEIEALILFLIAAVLLSATAIVQAINRVRKAIEIATQRLPEKKAAELTGVDKEGRVIERE